MRQRSRRWVPGGVGITSSCFSFVTATIVHITTHLSATTFMMHTDNPLNLHHHSHILAEIRFSHNVLPTPDPPQYASMEFCRPKFQQDNVQPGDDCHGNLVGTPDPELT